MSVRRHGALLACIGLFGTIAGVRAHAQNAPPTPDPPNFGRLFPQPSGTNGYEEWVQAGDLIQNNALYRAVWAEEKPTLAMKRRTLDDPQIQTALHLLHQGLTKPIRSPHVTLDENTTFGEYASFRALARLLYVEMYVQFADGRIDQALDTLDDGLRFGYRMQSDALISGLVGLAVDAIVLKGVSRHLDQLSQYQFNRIRRMVEDMAEWPSPVAHLLEMERQTALRELETKRLDPQALLKMLDDTSTDDETGEETVNPDYVAFRTYLEAHPGEYGLLLERAKARIAAHFDVAIANLKAPITERRPLPVAGGDSPDGKLFALITPGTDIVIDKYTRMDAMIRMLGVHAAIRGYRWEHDNLPPSLAVLHLGKLALDPFTGKSLFYQPNGTGYDLYSRGPLDQSNLGQNAAPQPTPVRL